MLKKLRTVECGHRGSSDGPRSHPFDRGVSKVARALSAASESARAHFFFALALRFCGAADTRDLSGSWRFAIHRRDDGVDHA